MEHSYWGFEQTISFIVNNFLFAVVCGALLAVLHKGLLTLTGWIDKGNFISRKLLWPEIGLASATLLGLSIWVVRYRLPSYQQRFVFLVLILVYLGCMIFARLLQRKVLSKSSFSLLGKLTLFAIFGPVVIACVIQFARDFKQQSVKPPANAVNHVILISVDTLRWDYVGAYGAVHVRTPVMNQLAAEGALFEQAFSLMPETGPSHMSMLTGLSPLTHGVLRNGYGLPNGIPAVTTYLRQAGFRTGGFVSGIPLQVSSRLDRGFQTYDDHFSWIDAFDGSYCGRFVSDLPFLSKYLARNASSTTDSALKWLKKNVDSPFFLFLHYYDPHFPYGGNIKSNHRDRAAPEDLPRQKKLYGIEVETVDGQIGRIVAFLKQNGVYDQSLLIFTADHGENLGEHGHFYGHSSLYQPVIRVPMIVRYPGKIAPRTVVTQQVALTDIFRTILQATKLESKQAPKSIDLVGLANGHFDSPHQLLVSNIFFPEVKHSVRNNEWELIRNDDPQRTYELYHLLTDPSESVNVYSSQTSIARQLEAILNRELGRRVQREFDNLSPDQIENLKALGYIN